MAAPDNLDFNHESGYTAPGFNAVAFAFPYLPPPANSVDFDAESNYTAPHYQSVDFDIYSAFGPPVDPTDPIDPGEYTGTISATTDEAAGSATAIATQPASIGTASSTTEPATANVAAAHGITGTASATTDDTDAQAGGQQAAVAAINATTDSSTGTATAEYIQSYIGTAAITTDAATGASQAIMEVFCLSGAVQDANGFPMERTVRAHQLNDGSLAAETVTNSAGIFDINVGFESAEFYVIALDTGPEGTDYLPPVTNRVTSVLRYD